VLLLMQLRKTFLHPLQVMLLMAFTVKLEATKLLRDYKQTMLDSIKSTVDEAINPFAEQLSKHAGSAAELAQGVKDLPKMVDDAVAKRLDGQNRRLQEQLDGIHTRLRAHKTRLDTHDSDISFLKAEIKKLHELLAVANDVPKAPLVSAAGFDRDTDPCVIKVIAAKLTALEHVQQALSDWIAEVGVEAKFSKISSSEAVSRSFSVDFVVAREIRDAFKEIDSTKRWFVDKDRGYVMAGWDPILRISPNPGNAPPTLNWADNLITKLGLPKQQLSAAAAAIV
ncbi:unnamed protein product, partial [Prorocentrum cordatum]